MTKRKKSEVEAEGREVVVALVVAAAAGDADAEWLDEAIRAAGYVHPEWGVRQNELTREASLSRQVLSEWEDAGVIPTRSGKRRSKWYPLWGLIRGLRERYVQHGGGSGDLTQERTELVKEQRRAKRRENDEADGLLIPRTAHEQSMITMATQIRASLLTMIPSVTAHLKGAERKRMQTELESHIRWQLDQMAAGNVALSERLLAAVDKAVRENAK